MEENREIEETSLKIFLFVWKDWFTYKKLSQLLIKLVKAFIVEKIVLHNWVLWAWQAAPKASQNHRILEIGKDF